MATNATPFELRLEMLKMAKDYLDAQYSIAVEATKQSWKVAYDFAQEMHKEVPKLEMPKMYGADEIAKMAETFNKFVSGSK